MLKHKCSCGRETAPGQSLCGLCALGLTPSRPVDLSVGHQAGLRVEAHADSGTRCPRCSGKLSFAEVAREACPYCHASLAPQKPKTRFSLQSERPRDDNPKRAELSRADVVHIWPEKASLR